MPERPTTDWTTTMEHPVTTEHIGACKECWDVHAHRQAAQHTANLRFSALFLGLSLVMTSLTFHTGFVLVGFAAVFVTGVNMIRSFHDVPVPVWDRRHDWSVQNDANH